MDSMQTMQRKGTLKEQGDQADRGTLHGPPVDGLQ